jgi:hypothetical protein
MKEASSPTGTRSWMRGRCSPKNSVADSSPRVRAGFLEDRFQVVADSVGRDHQALRGWGEILGDAMVAAALIDRLVHHATMVTLKGKSYRLRERGSAPASAARPTPVK